MLPRDCDACMRASHAVALQGVAELNRRYDDLCAGYRQWIDRADAAIAEVARLREALEQVMSISWWADIPHPWPVHIVKAHRIARAALATAKGDK